MASGTNTSGTALAGRRRWAGLSFVGLYYLMATAGLLVALVVGPKELEAGVVGLRPLRSDEEQRSVPRAAIVDEVKAFVGRADAS